jgi:hypothetical protein
MSEGQVIAGGVVSTTVTVKLQLTLFPLVSVAVQVTVVVPIEKSEPDSGAQTTVGLASQMPVVVTVKLAGVPAGPAHSTTMFGGHWMAGGIVPSTVTVKLHALLWPLASVAAQFTVVVPSENNDPDAGVQATVGFASQVSLAVGLKLTGVPSTPAHWTVRFAGQVIIGGVVSTTVTVKLQLLLLPLASVVVQVTVVVPSGKSEPEAGTQATVGLVSQTSLALAL